MMCSARQTFAAIVALIAFVSVARADQVENPSFDSWAKCKVGTSIVLQTDSEIGGKSQQFTSHAELTGVTDTDCTVRTSMTLNGRPMDVPEKIEKFLTDPRKVQEYHDMQSSAVDDTVTVAAGTFKCKKMKHAMASGDEATLWSDMDVPGGVVKMEIRKAGTLKMSMELQSIDQK